MITRRRLNIQARKRMDWRDPDMPVVRRPFIDVGFGRYEQREMIMTPDESQDLAQESLGNALQRNSGFPDWKTDPSYSWAEQAKKKRGRT